MFTVQVAALGYSVCLQRMSLCRHYGHTAPAHGPALQINHFEHFTSLKICQKERWPKKIPPQDLCCSTPSLLHKLAGCLFYCVSHHHQGWCQNHELGVREEEIKFYWSDSHCLFSLCWPLISSLETSHLYSWLGNCNCLGSDLGTRKAFIPISASATRVT